jgi:predicted nucleic acid-binding protein
MKAFFDTSVLVPVFYGDHVHHQASLATFVQFDKSTGCCGAHSLVEVYSTLTRMPGKHRISGRSRPTTTSRRAFLASGGSSDYCPCVADFTLDITLFTMSPIGTAL